MLKSPMADIPEQKQQAYSPKNDLTERLANKI